MDSNISIKEIWIENEALQKLTQGWIISDMSVEEYATHTKYLSEELVNEKIQKLEEMLKRSIAIIEKVNTIDTTIGTYFQFVEEAKQLLKK